MYYTLLAMPDILCCLQILNSYIKRGWIKLYSNLIGYIYQKWMGDIFQLLSIFLII